MTAQKLSLPPSGGRPSVRSFISPISVCDRLARRPLVHQRRRASQVIGDDPEADPSSGAISASIATAPQPVASFDHADATFAANAPPLSAAKPALALMRAPRRRFPAGPGQDHPTHPARDRGLFIRRRRESTISRRDIRRSIKHREMSIQCWRPQRHVGGAPVVHLVG